MDRKAEVRLSRKEVRRLQIPEDMGAGGRTYVSASQALGVTERWIRGLLRNLKRLGAAGSAHADGGRPSPHRIPQAYRRQIRELSRQKYEGFNLTPFGEMLQDQGG